MNPPEPPRQRYASAAGPVNRRTAAQAQAYREAAATPQIHPAVKRSLRQKLARGQAQHLLGSPLRQQLGPRPPSSRTSKTTILLALGLTLSATGLLLAGLQRSPLLAAASAGLGLVALGFTVAHNRARGRRPGSSVADQPGMNAAPVFDPQTLTALDQVLEQLASKVPAATLAQLAGLKTSLVRLAPLLARGTVSEVFTQDDRFYITELVRRYLPDTLTAYLQVPTAQREAPGADGRSARELLDEQLALLQAELSRREALLVQVASEALQQQQRFLRAKHRGD